ncbi:MAG: damage-control phosphatase ARMT1 family protein [Armatimonadota bacterium]
MKTYLECFPCLVQQAVDAIQQTVADAEAQTAILHEALDILRRTDPQESPPIMAQKIHRTLRSSLGEQDLYRKIKDKNNAFALKLYQELQMKVLASHDPFGTAVRLAIAANIIDYGPKRRLSNAAMIETIEQAQNAPLDGSTLQEFREAVEAAESILYLADNAGEIVFDRLLVEQLPIRKVVLAVRGTPVINDATMVDARAAGLAEIVQVIDNGSDVPGTALQQCSTEFLKAFDSADLVIAKGQGNLETLYGLPKPIYFLLLAKCPLIARELECEVGEMIIRCPMKRIPGDRCEIR